MAELWRRFLEGAGVKGIALVLCPFKDLFIGLAVICRPGERTDLSLKQLVGFYFGEGVEENYTEDNLDGLLGTSFYDIADNVLAYSMEDMSRGRKDEERKSGMTCPGRGRCCKNEIYGGQGQSSN
jgi:hypothetical protein